MGDNASQFKAYKTTVNGNTEYSVLPGYNTPFGYTEINKEELLNNATPDQLSRLLGDVNNSFGGQTGVKYNSLLDAFGGSTGYQTGPNGELTTNKAVTEQAANEAAVKAGTMKNIGTASAPLYVPTGSAADKLSEGIKNGSVSPTDPNAQMAASMQGNNVNAPGVVPNAPDAPAPAKPAAPTPGLQMPTDKSGNTANAGQTFDQVLGNIYNSRPDLQELYNPDGSAKNPNDPRINGIPTLQAWAQQYGIKEHPDLATASGGANPQPVAGTEAANAKTDTATQAYSDLLAKYGIKDNPEIADPEKYVMDVYNKVYANLGVAAAKTQYDTYNKQLLDLRNEKTDEIAKINNNPWYTEGKRVNEIAKLGDKYDQKEANLVAFMTLANTMYENGLQQSQFVTSNALNFIQDQQNFKQSLALNELNFQQQREQKAADARFTLSQGLPFYKYEGNPTVYSTDTGKPISSKEQYQALGGNGDYSDVHEILGPATQITQAQILDLMQKYPDAGIRATDTLDLAEAKVAKSAIYHKQNYIKNVTTFKGGSSTTRRTNSGSGGGGNTTTNNTGITVPPPPKSASANNIRNWIAAAWHKYAGRQAYWDVWGTLADAMRSAGIDPSKYDKTFWDVFRPGEYNTVGPGSKKSSAGTSTKSDPLDFSHF